MTGPKELLTYYIAAERVKLAALRLQRSDLIHKIKRARETYDGLGKVEQDLVERITQLQLLIDWVVTAEDAEREREETPIEEVVDDF